MIHVYILGAKIVMKTEKKHHQRLNLVKFNRNTLMRNRKCNVCYNQLHIIHTSIPLFPFSLICTIITLILYLIRFIIYRCCFILHLIIYS